MTEFIFKFNKITTYFLPCMFRCFIPKLFYLRSSLFFWSVSLRLSAPAGCHCFLRGKSSWPRPDVLPSPPSPDHRGSVQCRPSSRRSIPPPYRRMIGGRAPAEADVFRGSDRLPLRVPPPGGHRKMRRGGPGVLVGLAELGCGCRSVLWIAIISRSQSQFPVRLVCTENGRRWRRSEGYQWD